MQLDAWLQRVWYGRSLWRWLLAPLAFLFAAMVYIRRGLYRIRCLPSVKVHAPVIVVGNLTVGGTGKTPFVVWLASMLRDQGYIPGIITRGYGGHSPHWPVQVTSASDPNMTGDEAVMLAAITNAIVVAGPDRVADARRAIALGANVIVSDDGLQHYRLARDIEFALVDAERGLGNGWYLPAGPLREGRSRLRTVDAVILHQRGGVSLDMSASLATLAESVPCIHVASELGDARCLTTGERRPLSMFVNQRVHALAGIGYPEAFFAALRAAGLEVDARPLADHAALTQNDLVFVDDAAILMTEKDAVKCRAFADARCWAVTLTLTLREQSRVTLSELLQSKLRVS